MEREESVVLKIGKKSIKFFVAVIYITFVVALSFGSMVAGILTVIPADLTSWEVSKASPLGYYSVCSFAPYSTLILVAMAVVGFILLVKMLKYFKRKAKSSKIHLRVKMPTQKV